MKITPGRQNFTDYFNPPEDYQLVVLFSLFLVLSANVTFFRELTNLYPWALHSGFIFSAAVLLFSLLVFITALLCLCIPTRIVITILLMIAAVAGYYTDGFGTIIDVDMIRNTLQTNAGEAGDLLSTSLVLRFLVLGAIPTYVLWCLPSRSTGRMANTAKILITGLVALGTMLFSLLPYTDQYSSFFRNHKQVRYYTNPAYPVWSIGNYFGEAFSNKNNTLHYLNAGATINEKAGDPKELVILVVGETARADHFAINGYHRDTTPLLSAESNILNYSNVSACGTSTAVSVPCMFAYDSRENFNLDSASNTENALDVLSKAGVNVLWRDNNSSSKGVADRVTFEDFRTNDVNPVCDSECRDIGMLDSLQEYIDRQWGDILIVLHQMGSHGPAYSRRYPKTFEYFTPACQSTELATCSREEIINAYDNTIRYTDYFLSNVIALLKKNTPEYETSMLYISDHGESLGERGVYLHGMPYRFAPRAQTHVPAIIWAGESSDIDYQNSVTKTVQSLSHDVVFDFLMRIFEVDSSLAQVSDNQLVVLKDRNEPG